MSIPITPNQVAYVLVNDMKDGGVAVSPAEFYGNIILEPLRANSNDFNKLNRINSVRLAEVLVSSPSPEKFRLAIELFNRNENIYAKLVGSIGLIANGYDVGEINEQSLIVQAAMGELKFIKKDYESYQLRKDRYSVLGIIGLSKTKNRKVLSYLFKILDVIPEDYVRHSQACKALEELSYIEAVPILEQKMLDVKFDYILHAFRALLRLDKDKAIKSAITRIAIDTSNKQQINKLISALEKATGERFGADTKAWLNWLGEQPIN
ncbi:MAG: hypothetical protein PHP00_10585 [Thiotrichaceae bacterium]|nr:hypothetical protein [Thiotrichaceae bacterium]